MKTSGCESIFCHLQEALQCTIPDVMTLHHLTKVHVGFGMRKRHPLLKRPKQGEATSEQNRNSGDAQFINEICPQEILHRATAINVQRMMTLGMDLSQHLDGTARKQRRMLREALRIANATCPLASQHFAKAKKMRSWNFLISQYGYAEVIVGILAIDQGRMSFGIANAALGGVALTFFSDRDKKIQEELDEGVEVYNRCQLLN